VGSAISKDGRRAINWKRAFCAINNNKLLIFIYLFGFVHLLNHAVYFQLAENACLTSAKSQRNAGRKGIISRVQEARTSHYVGDFRGQETLLSFCMNAA
jgi:hypothetical protein